MIIDGKLVSTELKNALNLEMEIDEKLTNK